jgi:sugar lactone lactonase YvrE
MLGAAVITEAGKLLLALESGLALYDFEGDKLSDLNVLENTDSEMRFNDGKVSPDGSFFIGTMHKKFVAETGNLYRVTANFQTSVLLAKTTISNGMAWSPDQTKFYYIDSPTFEVLAFDYDRESGTLSNQKSAFKVPKDYGSPDGMCIDVEGMLWVAHWGGNCIRRWNPKSGTLLEKIEVPAPHVTSCCFGGKNLDILYITTASSGMSKEQIEKFPLSGGIFECRMAVKGLPIHYFKDKQ